MTLKDKNNLQEWDNLKKQRQPHKIKDHLKKRRQSQKTKKPTKSYDNLKMETTSQKKWPKNWRWPQKGRQSQIIFPTIFQASGTFKSPNDSLLLHLGTRCTHSRNRGLFWLHGGQNLSSDDVMKIIKR